METRALEERKGDKLHNDKQENQTKHKIQFISTKDISLYVNNKYKWKRGVAANKLGSHNKKLFDDEKIIQS